MRGWIRPEAAFVVALGLASCSANSNQIGVQLDGGAGASGSSGVAGSSAGAGGGSAAGTGGSVGVAGSAGGGVSAGGSVGVAGGSAGGGVGAGGSVGVAGGSAGGSVGAGGSAGNADAGGVAGSTGAAGAMTGVVQPRALIVDPATSRFVAYDRDGQLVHDYLSRLDLGSGFAGRYVIANGAQLAWDSGTSVVSWNYPPPGFAEALEPSRLMIRGDTSPVLNTKVRMFGVDNQSASDVSLMGSWRSVDLSPRRNYLFASGNMTASAPNLVAVTRISDGASLFRQQVVQATFARDDLHFLYVPMDRSIPVRVLDLATRAETTPALTQPAFATQPGVWVELVAATNGRAIILTEGVSKFGRLLWVMNWQAKVDRLGPDTPEYMDEYFQSFSPSGDKAVWSRQNNGLDGKTIAYAGAYQQDFVSMTSSAWTGTNFICFERPNQVVFTLKTETTSAVVQSCHCGTGACADIATIEIPEAGWVPQLKGSGNSVMVTWAWSRSGMATVYPDVQCLNNAGQLLATLPHGVVEVDATGQMALLREGTPTGSRRLGIVNLATGGIAWVGTPASTAIVYE